MIAVRFRDSCVRIPNAIMQCDPQCSVPPRPTSPHLPGLEVPVHKHARRDYLFVATVTKLAVEQVSVVAVVEIFRSSLEPQLVCEGTRLQVFAAMCTPVLLFVRAGGQRTLE